MEINPPEKLRGYTLHGGCIFKCLKKVHIKLLWTNGKRFVFEHIHGSSINVEECRKQCIGTYIPGVDVWNVHVSLPISMEIVWRKNYVVV